MAMSVQPSNPDAESNIDKISEITEFYSGCNVLLTGGSGFVGLLLLEKLLRSCPNIRKLYVILRAKKGKSPEERYRDLFADSVFDRLKQEQPHFISKIVMIEGEFNQSGLAISSESRELIKDSHIVFHGAATVRFEDKLRFAVNINVRGTKEIFMLCKQMPNIKAIVYIGTAFSHCIHEFIDEIFYEPSMDSDKLLALLDILNDEQLETLTPMLVGKYPNTYAFSKATAENVVLKHGEGLPACIVRPSIMISTEREPIPGWINNIYGPTGVVAGTGVGLLHCLHAKITNVAEMIPADYVINNIIASAWDVGTMWQSRIIEPPISLKPDDGEVVKKMLPIYNSVSSVQNPITWAENEIYIRLLGPEVPSSLAIWYYFFFVSEKLWLIQLFTFAFHIVPAVIVDTLARLTGREAKLLEAYKKVHKFTTVISYFCMRQWKFGNDNVMKLWDKMSPMDRKIFYLNVSELKWMDYYYYYLRGIRVFLLKDPLDNLEESRKKYFKLQILHYTVATILSALLLWLLYILMSMLFSNITV